MLLNIYKAPTTKNVLAPNVNSVEVEKVCPRKKKQCLQLADYRSWSSERYLPKVTQQEAAEPRTVQLLAHATSPEWLGQTQKGRC